MTPSELMFREQNWLPFYKRVNYHKCVLMYKSLNNIAPDYLTERFMKVSEPHNRQLRSADNDLLKFPYSRTKYYANSFTVSGAKLWNSLPLNIRQSPSIDSFKCSIIRLTNLKLTHSDVMEGVPRFPFIMHFCRCSLILKCQGFR